MRYNALLHGSPAQWDRQRAKWLGGSKPQTASTSVTYSPEETAFRNQVMQAAGKLFGTGEAAAYPGAQPVPFSANTVAGQNAALAAVPGMNDTATAANAALKFSLSDVLRPESNPALQSYIQGAVRPITESYTDPGGVMGQIRTGASGAGQFGSSRQGIAEGVAAGRYANAVGDTTAKITNEAYGQGLDAMGRALALAPQTQQMLLAGPEAQAAIGHQQELYQQDVNQYNADKALWDINAPWTNLQNFANIVYGGSTPTTTSTQTGGGQSTIGRLAGGAAAGIGTANALTSLGGMAASMATPIGWAIGLASLFS